MHPSNKAEKAFKQINVPEYHKVFLKRPSVPNFQQLMGVVNFTSRKELKKSNVKLATSSLNEECDQL